MKRVKTLLAILVVFTFLMSSLTVMTALAMTNAPSPLETRATRGTVVSTVVESAHNYANNFDYTWTITQSGASQIRAYFYRYQVESNYDYIYIYDKAGTQLTSYTSSTSKYYVWTPWATGDTIKIRLKTDYSVTYYGFRITQYEYESGGGGGGGELTSGVPVSSSLSSTGATEMWTIQVNSNAQSMRSVLDSGSADFDLYGKLGSAPTTSVYDWRGYTSGGEDVTYNSPGAGTWYIMVRSYSGSGPYTLTVTITYQTADTQAPTVSITNPADGATVSGTVTVQASASDNVGVTEVRFYIDGSLKTTDTSSPYSYSWDTTGYSDGSHAVKAVAYDAAGNNAEDTNTVTVSNGGGGGNELTSGQTVYSSLSAVGATEMWTIDVEANAQTMHSVLNCGSADFDLYGRLGAAPTTSVYDWRGYTSGGEDVTFNYPGQGTWYIMVRSYSGTGSYDLTVTITYGGGGGGSWGTGGKYAIIVGISDYQSISDLSYCDEDATDWYNKLNAIGYECHVYGDGHTSNYPRYDGTATEATVRAAMQELAQHAQAGDSVCFITSGHGAGNGLGSSYLCMYDCSGSAGCYYDTELAADVSGFQAGVKIFIFIDHCYSGGMGPELMALSISQYIYCTTTCTQNGYGYDDPTHQNGAWTYYFLQYSWISHYGGSTSTSMETVFGYALSNYPYDGGDTPQQFDGNTGSAFYL